MKRPVGLEIIWNIIFSVSAVEVSNFHLFNYTCTYDLHLFENIVERYYKQIFIHANLFQNPVHEFSIKISLKHKERRQYYVQSLVATLNVFKQIC